MDQIITFNKSYQDRLIEYTDVLAGYENLPASEIIHEWSFYLEVTMDSCGWQAIWKIPRSTCEKLKIEFPTVVLVYVQNVSFENLSANVVVLSVQDDIDLPKQHCVPLIELWPTREQDKSVCLNLTSTANGIDMLRFFYINLFLPWDMDEDNMDWFNKHLVSRLRLFYDLRNGTIPEASADLSKGLLTEARHLQSHKDHLLPQIGEDVQVNSDPTSQNADVQSLLNSGLRMMQIRNQLEFFENPVLRTSLLSDKPQSPKQLNTKVQNWVIFEEGKIEDFLDLFYQIKNDIGNQDVTFQSNLSMALESANVNDRILLNSSKHIFNTLGAIQEGGVIRGISSDCNTTLSSINNDIMLDCCGDIIFENLHIDVGIAQCGILARCGTVTLKHCKITGSHKSSTQKGIIVFGGGELIIENCQISGFYTGIVINSNALFTLNNSSISNVNIGLKFYENCKIEMANTKFQDCIRHGICMDSSNVEISQEGSFDIFANLHDIVIKDIISERIGKQPAKINHKRKLEPVKDLLAISNLNPAYIQSAFNNEDEVEDSEMDISSASSKLDNTIINIKCSNGDQSIE